MMTCIFCKTIAGEMPSTKVYESTNVVGIFDIHPTNKGHTLLIPKQHYESLLDVPAELFAELFQGVQKVGAAMIKGLDVKGFNVIVNNGSVAGQLIPHMHVHMIPRTLEDNLQHWPGGRYRGNEAEEYAGKLRQAIS